MIPLLAAIVLAGAAGAGPILVSDACGEDTTTDSETARCAVEEAERTMRVKKKPKELKVSTTVLPLCLRPSLHLSLSPSVTSAHFVRRAQGGHLQTTSSQLTAQAVRTRARGEEAEEITQFEDEK